MLYYIKFEFNYIFIVIYTMMIKKEAVGMNKRICTAAAVLALTMCTVHAEAVYNLDEVIVEADMDKARMHLEILLQSSPTQGRAEMWRLLQGKR